MVKKKVETFHKNSRDVPLERLYYHIQAKKNYHFWARYSGLANSEA